MSPLPEQSVGLYATRSDLGLGRSGDVFFCRGRIWDHSDLRKRRRGLFYVPVPVAILAGLVPVVCCANLEEYGGEVETEADARFGDLDNFVRSVGGAIEGGGPIILVGIVRWSPGLGRGKGDVGG